MDAAGDGRTDSNRNVNNRRELSTFTKMLLSTITTYILIDYMFSRHLRFSEIGFFLSYSA